MDLRNGVKAVYPRPGILSGQKTRNGTGTEGAGGKAGFGEFCLHLKGEGV